MQALAAAAAAALALLGAAVAVAMVGAVAVAVAAATTKRVARARSVCFHHAVGALHVHTSFLRCSPHRAD
jgi:hypothetical protein